MNFLEGDIPKLPYARRLAIVIDVDQSIEKYFRRSARQPSNRPRRLFSRESRRAVAVRRLRSTKDAATQRWRDRKLEDIAESDILPVTAKQAGSLEFPAGHPLKNVVYIADPGVPERYFPVSSFHRAMFDDKYSEVIRLLRSLGAERIEIEYVQGFERAGGINLTVPGEGRGGLHISSKRTMGSTLTMELRPEGRPRLPRDLVWYRSEPLWQEIAEARLEHSLHSFKLDLRYSDDFGVNGDLTAKIQDIGLELGGDFRKFRETLWKISGTFRDG